MWSLYKNGTLRARLQDFFVTEEVREELASGEELEVIVTIEEGEYQKALHELSSEMEGNLLIHDYPVSIFTSKPSFLKLKSTPLFSTPRGRVPYFF